jgi:hypothetical protein
MMTTRREDEIARAVEAERAKLEYKQRRKAQEAEAREREQVAIKFEDKKGYQWTEWINKNNFQQYSKRGENKRLYMYSEREGYNDTMVVGISAAPPVRGKRKEIPKLDTEEREGEEEEEGRE